jgi:hypothetical protein
MLPGSAFEPSRQDLAVSYGFLYQHTKRVEWGYGAVTETKDDRTSFKFDDGITRTITRDHIHLMIQVELEEPEASEVHKRIARHVKSSLNGDKKRVVKKKKAPAVAKAAPVVAEEPG